MPLKEDAFGGKGGNVLADVSLHRVSSQGSWVWDSGFGGFLTLCVLNVHTVLFLFYLFMLAALDDMWDFSFRTRD